jgi:hypothetical protein
MSKVSLPKTTLLFKHSEIHFRSIAAVLLFLVLTSFHQALQAQSLPTGTLSLEDHYRDKQLSGMLDSTVSFMVRPLSPVLIDRDSMEQDNLIRLHQAVYAPKTKGIKFALLPAVWQQQVQGHPAYRLNDGSMIPAKGYQSQISAGIFAQYGPLSVQLRPEYVFAANPDFQVTRTYYGSADLPGRFGDEPYSRLSWGQSSIRLNAGPVSLGLSNENLWWGPGIYNSLLMSNQAAGFKHLTLNTSRPIRTPIGSLEGQVIGARLEGSGYTALLPDDWRYLSAIALSYQPRWVPGLFLGFARSFQTYHEDLGKGFGDYFPLFQAFQKANTDEDSKRRDQIVSLFGRWLIPAAKAEVYFEYGLNDHSYNIRDFLMAPEHSRAYTIGMRKLLPYKSRTDEYIQLGLELTHMEQSIDRIIRSAGDWYTHSQLLHGYTNRGEVLGAGIGSGSNFQILSMSWVRGIKQLGFQLERYEHNGGLANAYNYNPWTDFSIGARGNWGFDSVLLNAKIQGTQSVNYQWRDGRNGREKKDIFFMNLQVGVMYSF